MKVIKRDGRAVDYDKSKIEIAIEKANKEVKPEKRITKQEIQTIIEFIESLEKKRILVEDIQDIIEQKLMELDKYELAKKYIVYRYKRALVRKSNSTDESILGLIRNPKTEFAEDNITQNPVIASTQRNYIAGEVSKDLTNRLLLPEKISKAHEEGILHFHNADYFVQPIFNCSYINIEDMLENGTVMNGKLMESPKTFQVACIITAQIITVVASNQYGGQSINLKHLGKYVRKSYEKFKQELLKEYKDELTEEMIENISQTRLKEEIRQGVQILQYQINTLITANGQLPYVTLFLHLDKKDQYIKENAMIIEEVLEQRNKGIKNEEGMYVTPAFPRLVYVLDENNCLNGGEYDYLTRLAIQCSSKRLYPDYISAKKMRKNYEGNVFCPMGNRDFLSLWKDENGRYKFEGRFNQGVVSINLPQVAIIANKDEKKFWKILDERLELCKEALMCRHYALRGITSDISPIHWKYGAISRLSKGEKIDKLLYGGYSELSLGYIGIYEMTKLMKETSHNQPEGHEFAIKVMKYLKEITKKWEKETNIGFSLYETSSENICQRFANIDQQLFGKIKDINDKGYYTNSYHINEKEKIDMIEKLKIESEFQDIALGGVISYIDIEKQNNTPEKLEEIIKFIYNNIQYAEFNIEK